MKQTLATLVLFCGLTYWYLDHDAKTLPVPAPWADVVIEAKPATGSLKSPDGTEDVACPLPETEKKKNVGGRDGAGLCVFTSIEYAARYQNEPRLWDFQQKMRSERGGGWPEKVDQMIRKYANGVSYVQHTGGDMDFLKLAIKTGRMPGITYGGYDPHYRGYVAHMVSLAHLSDKWGAITDNNFPKDNQYVWMSPDELKKRWLMGGGGWAVVLIGPPPSPKVQGY